MTLSKIVGAARKLREECSWLFRPESLPQSSVLQRESPVISFFRWLAAPEKLEDKPRQIRRQKGFLRRICEWEILEEKPVLRRGRKGFLRWVSQRETLP